GCYGYDDMGRMLPLVLLPPVVLAGVAGAMRYRRHSRRQMGDAPMIWKEVFAEGGFRLGWFSRILTALLAIGCIVPGALLHFAARSGWSSLAQETNQYVRLVGTLGSCIVLLAVGIRAASSVGSERDKQTWDGLLTTPLSNREILFGKWLGSISSARWLLGLLAIIWFLGILGGGLSIIAPILLLMCLTVYAAFMVSLGLVFGVLAKTTLRAVMGTVFAGLVAGGVPYFCYYLLTEGDPIWSVPTVFAVLGLSALFVSSPLLAVGVWVKRTFRSLRGLTVAVYLMCGFPLVGYFVVLTLLEHGSEYTFRTWGYNVVSGITPAAVLADSAYYVEVTRYVPQGPVSLMLPGSWDYDRPGRALRVLCRALGLIAYAFITALLWFVAQSRF